MAQIDSRLTDASTNHPVNVPSADAPRPTILPLAPSQFFATPIWVQRLTSHTTLNPQLIDALKRLEEAAPSLRRSNIGGWHSASNLHLDPAFKSISKAIERMALRCALSLEFDFTRAHISVQSLWANRNGPGDYNAQHVHPHAFLSGSYYLTVPQDSGNIEFVDPLRERVMSEYPLRADAKRNIRRMEYDCVEGTLIMFPSWLPHSVKPNKSKEARYSLAFNIECHPKRGLHAPSSATS